MRGEAVGSEMDHIHEALIGPGFRVTSPLKRKPSSCGVCRLKFNSEAQASSHYSGTKHAKRLKALDAPDTKIRTCEPVAKETTSQLLPSACLQPSSSDTTSGEASIPKSTSESTPSSSGLAETVKAQSNHLPLPTPKTQEKETHKDGEAETPEEETEEEKAVRLLYCSLCKVAVNSASQLQAHNSGTKHKTMLEARSGDGAIKSFPRVGVKAKMAAPSESSTGLQNKTFHCEICDVHVNSETQLKQHISSRRHKDRAAGKPAKPKFSPYTPTQRQQSFQAAAAELIRTDSRWIKSALKMSPSLHRDYHTVETCQDKADFTEEPRPDQTSGLLSHTAPALSCRCHGFITPIPPPACLKLQPRPLSQPTPPTGAASSGTRTHLRSTHVSSVFPLLTPISDSISFELRLKADPRPEQDVI
ncbi:zinc finger protein 385D-like isoform 2-T2 [Pholidichthys leucotaenia]